MDSLSEVFPEDLAGRLPRFTESLRKTVRNVERDTQVSLLSEEWTSAMAMLEESRVRNIAISLAVEIGLRDRSDRSIEEVRQALTSIIRVCRVARASGIPVVVGTGPEFK